MTRIEVARERPPSDWRDEILRLLTAVNHEFVPPLSARSSTTDRDLRNTGETTGLPLSYLDQVMAQSMIAAWDGGLIGMLSFIPTHRGAPLDGVAMPCTYVSTVAVDPTRRRAGLARMLYAELLLSLPSMTPATSIVTRTWSGNTSHLDLLASLDFHVAHRIPDDRGPGIDTVYVVLERRP